MPSSRLYRKSRPRLFQARDIISWEMGSTMAVAIQEQNGVRIQLFQDQGDNEVRPG